jgi:N-acyl-D-aspartate/D-glutamate deacylase
MSRDDSRPDILIRNATVFDGSKSPPLITSVLVQDGVVSKIGDDIATPQGAEIVDASGMWLIPGMLDIHTHVDLEVEVNPGLSEVVRHGTTTVVVGNCSLGTAFGAQRRNNESPILDCFTRVENMPKPVLQKCVDKMHWDNTADYFKHFENIPLGPNIAAFVPHSMLRVEVMGLGNSVSREPTKAERHRIRELFEQALDEGYLGLSSDQIVFHYLSNDPNKDKRIPTQFASDEELRELVELTRDYDRVWQTNPDSDKMTRTLKRFFWTSARFRKKPLKITALTAIDFIPAPGTWKQMLRLGSMLNSWLFKGRINFQALSTNFRIWSNGVIAPFFEELESTRAVIACEAEDREGRQRIMSSPEWQALFKRDWEKITDGSRSTSIRSMVTFRLDMSRMFFDDCAIPAWDGDSLADVYARQRQWQSSRGKRGAKNKEDAAALTRFGWNIESEHQFFLKGLMEFDIGFRWWMDSANIDPDIVEEILFHPAALPGFNDSGAHITNMAFYDANLVTLKIAAKGSLERVAHAVHRLTAEPADFLGLDAGRIACGARADLVLIDPIKLKDYDTNSNRRLEYNPYFEHLTMVNRSDGVVNQVYINGARVWEEGTQVTKALGARPLGRFLHAGVTSAAA